jgi:hypothetical protein
MVCKVSFQSARLDHHAQVFHVITAIYVGSFIVVADVVLTIVVAAVQMVFVVSFAGQRKSTTNSYRTKKPGRQILRIPSFALWGLQTPCDGRDGQQGQFSIRSEN